MQEVLDVDEQAKAQELLGTVTAVEFFPEREGDDSEREPESVVEVQLTYADGRVVTLAAGSCSRCGVWWHS
jgi:hypothetical protein